MVHQNLFCLLCLQVPSWAHRRTRLTLYATAGLRMLRKSTADAIIESCRILLSGSPFLFKGEWASVLSGSNEGLYGWIAANFGAGQLLQVAESAQAPLGQHTGLAVVELGGASAQISFAIDGCDPILLSKAMPDRRSCAGLTTISDISCVSEPSCFVGN